MFGLWKDGDRVSSSRSCGGVLGCREILYNEQKEKERRSAIPPPLQSPLPPL